MNIFDFTAVELGKLIKEGKITSVEATKAVIEKIEATDEKYNAYITLNKDAALEQAKEADLMIKNGEDTSILAGVPIAIKDNITTKGTKTTCASHILDSYVPVYNATIIDKLNSAGMVVVGKLNMDEFAMGSTTETSYFGATKNPWNTNHVPGGSSGGAATAVSGNEAVCALGSDTGGSIRQPSSYCGVTGLKPTYGTVSRYGLIAYASSLDQIGPVAKNAEDCAAIFDIIKGKDEHDGTSLDIEYKSTYENLNSDVKGLKVGIPTECFGKGLDADVKKSVLEVAETLKANGAEYEYFDMPLIEYAVPTYYIIACAEASSNLSRFDGVKYGYRSDNYDDLLGLYKKTRSEGFGEEVKKRILLGNFTLSTGYYDAYYKKALQVKALIKEAFDKAFEKYDVILCPTAPSTAPELNSSLQDPMKMYLSDIYTVSVNLAGLPGISVPCGFDKSRMPVGAQIIGPALGEQKVLDTAYAYQKFTSYHKETPKEVK